MQRFCSACGGKVSVFSKSDKCWRCRERDEKQKQIGRKLQKLEELQACGLVLVHSCLAHPNDPLADCRCRKSVTFEQATELIQSGAAIDAESRLSMFCERSIIELRAMRTPRVATIEKAHIERVALSQSFKPQAQESEDERQERLAREYEALKMRISQDQAARAEEERLRWEVWRDLSEQFMRDLTIEVDAAVFDKAKADSAGRPFCFANDNDRTSIGRSVHLAMTFADDTGDDEDPISDFREVQIADTGHEIGGEDSEPSESDSEVGSNDEIILSQ